MTDRVAFIAAALALAFCVGLQAGRAEHIPSCPEDSVLVGAGNFEHGRWDAYACGPAADDYVGA